MCGIAGMSSTAAAVSRTLLVTMRDTMAHRGPDGAGVWISDDGAVGLAHRRLAIVDLSPRGHQPMSSSQGRCHIVFNGEIYNHCELRRRLETLGCRFAGSSDTEVLLESYRVWGPDCLQYLNGMFAFCLYDQPRQTLFLARDRAGEKPLFYCAHRRLFAFASELKALMANPTFPRELDLEAAGFYLAYGFIPGSRCILRHFQKLAPAHAMTYGVKDGRISIWRYWTLPERNGRQETSPDETCTDELESLLQDSVRRQLRADVPVGILLSGGIDSSLVTALASRVAAAPLKTFTVAFPGHASYDEGPHARLVARHFGTAHTEIVAEPATVELLPRLAAQYDEPIADSSMVPTYLVSRAIREHATVALGGDGGDELFGGYPQHRWIQRLDAVARYVPAGVGGWIGRCARKLLPVGATGRNYLAAVSASTPCRISCAGRLFDLETRAALLRPLAGAGALLLASPEEYKAAAAACGRTPLQQATIADFIIYLPEDILVKVDRASMLASLEVRAPWLDYRLIEFAFGRTPDGLRATARKGKILPRLLARRLLPRELDLSRKQGFSLPLSSWFRGQWGRFCNDVLWDPDQTVFDKQVIRTLVENQRRGYSNTSRLFALVMFELWRRRYRICI
jgi:asparagine synthase (glutamine-hydrolysing)